MGFSKAYNIPNTED